jgi:RND superfamily putative drug exporter
VQGGFIIGIGLLLDTFVVRTITVPALAVLMGNANWWPSGRRRKRGLPTGAPPPQETAEVTAGST